MTDYILPSLNKRSIYHSPDWSILSVVSLLERLHTVKFSQQIDRIHGILGLAADSDHLKLEVDVART